MGRHSAQRLRPWLESSFVPRNPMTVVDLGMVGMFLVAGGKFLFGRLFGS